jgi:general transcription factor 3C polypeptide 3 (transcription factor C subunit 4)
LDYPDLFQDAADALFETGLFDEALEFYRALWAENELEDEKLPLQMGKCHMRRGEHKEAEESFQAALAIDQDNIDARIQLAKLYEEVDEQEQAFIYINEVMKIKRAERRRKQQMNTDENSQELNSTLMPSNMRPKSYYRSRRLINAEERRKQEVAVAERLQEQYAIMRRERESMRAGDAEASMAWMNAAAELIDDFRGFKTFYPWDKYVRFLGYTATVNREQPHMGGTSLDADLAEMASRISTSELSSPFRGA